MLPLAALRAVPLDWGLALEVLSGAGFGRDAAASFVVCGPAPCPVIGASIAAKSDLEDAIATGAGAGIEELPVSIAAETKSISPCLSYKHAAGQSSAFGNVPNRKFALES